MKAAVILRTDVLTIHEVLEGSSSIEILLAALKAKEKRLADRPWANLSVQVRPEMEPLAAVQRRAAA